MKAILSFEIECGESTCASEVEKFCKYFTYSINGINRCYLFGWLGEKDGWVQRHKECLRAAASVLKHGVHDDPRYSDGFW